MLSHDKMNEADKVGVCTKSTPMDPGFLLQTISD